MQGVEIQIPKPCHEPLDQMTPSEKGKFCASCQQLVVDYSGLSDQELIQLLSKPLLSTCGFFREDQLNRSLVSLPKRGNLDWRYWIGVVTLGVFGWQNSRAQVSQPKTSSVITTARMDFVAASIPVQKKMEPDSKRVITGRVMQMVDDTTLKPATNVQVVIADEFTNSSTRTDSAGWYRVELPLQDYNNNLFAKNQKLKIHTFAPDFLPDNTFMEVRLSTASLEVKELVLQPLSPPVTIVGGGLVLIKRPNLWQRIRKTFLTH